MHLSFIPLRNLKRTLLLPKHVFPLSKSVISRKMELLSLVKVIEKLIPPNLAESWDNVGLLTQPSSPHQVNSILLTNDLTEDVLEEAVNKKVDMIFSYHPPIFVPLKRLTMKTWKQRLIVKCLENRIAIYSPHTAADAVQEGVNDWLISAFDVRSVAVLNPAEDEPKVSVKLTATENQFPIALDVLKPLCEASDITIHTSTTADGFEKKSATAVILDSLKFQLADIPEVSTEFTSVSLGQPIANGGGRRADLKSPSTIRDSVEAVKSYLGLTHLRLALGSSKTLDSKVSSVAVCPGSGSSVLRSVNVDLLLTGEMSHHDALDHVAAGRTVILVEHSNSERGYLRVFGNKLSQAMGNANSFVNIQYSQNELCRPGSYKAVVKKSLVTIANGSERCSDKVAGCSM